MLLEQLLKEFEQRGRRLAYIKHTAGDFQFDEPGKDTWRLAQAGSKTVIISSTSKIALIKHVEYEQPLEKLLNLIGDDIDLVLVEGFRETKSPKIEVHRKELGSLYCSPDELVAIVTDEYMNVPVPQFSPHEIKEIANIIEKSSSDFSSEDDLALLVNGREVALNHFAKSIMSRTLQGMVSSLKGTTPIENIQISLRRGP